MATVRADYYGASASEPAGVSAETGVAFNREDTKSGVSAPIPIPVATGTAYSWRKNIALNVTAATATSLLNRRAYLSGAASTGLALYFKAASTYTQASDADHPADAGTNGAVPSTYTALTATTLGAAQSWDSSTDSANATGRNGDFIVLLLGVSNNFAGGAGSGTALPTINLAYDEQ